MKNIQLKYIREFVIKLIDIVAVEVAKILKLIKEFFKSSDAVTLRSEKG